MSKPKLKPKDTLKLEAILYLIVKSFKTAQLPFS